MGEFLAFRKMTTPVVIQVIFWLGTAIAVIAGLASMTSNVLYGLAMIAFGPLVIRIYCEILIVVFAMNDALQDIKSNTGRGG